MRYRIVDNIIVFPRRGDPPVKSPLPGYRRDPNDQYQFLPVDCKYYYPTCNTLSCCKLQVNNCILYGVLGEARPRCKDCKDKVLD